MNTHPSHDEHAASRPFRHLTALQQLIEGIPADLELTDHQLKSLLQVADEQSQTVLTNLVNIADKWQNELPRAEHLDVDWEAEAKTYRDMAKLPYISSPELQQRLKEIQATLRRIQRTISHPKVAQLRDLYQKYQDRMTDRLADRIDELDEWMQTLTHGKTLRPRRLKQRLEALRQELIESGFLGHLKDGADQPLEAEEALEELFPEGLKAGADRVVVARYIYHNIQYVTEGQIEHFFAYVLLGTQVEEEIAALDAPSASASPAAATPDLDPYDILHPEVDKPLVMECVRQAEKLVGQDQYKNAHLMKVMFDHNLLRIGQSDHEPFARTLEHWQCSNGKPAQLIKGSIRQRLNKMKSNRNVQPGQDLPVYRLWPDDDPDKKICVQIAQVFNQAGF